MDLKGKRIILGSNSPRRRELLAGLDVAFTVDTDNTFDEVFDSSVPHSLVPAMMSEGKSFGFHRTLEEGEILITADTMVLVDDVIMGKPHTHQQALEMLTRLSGREHKVITAVTLRDVSHVETFSDTTAVWFDELSAGEIEYYIEKYSPFDKAGAYGIQEWIGYATIGKIEGSFYNVMGFPVHKVYRGLKKFINY